MSKVILLSCTEDPELVVATAAKLCYSSFEPETIVGALECDSKGIEKSICMLKRLGHLSPFEHANFTFAITDVSRSFWLRSPGIGLQVSAFGLSVTSIWLVLAW